MHKLNIKANIPRCKIKNDICIAIDKIRRTFPDISINKYISEIKENNRITSTAQIEGGILTLKEGISLQEIIKRRTEKTGTSIFSVNPDIPEDLDTNEKYVLSPINTNNAIGLIVHELGHSLSGGDDDFYSDFVDFIEKKTGKQDYILTTAYKNLSLNSLIGDSEFFADAFSDYIINNSKASESGKLMPLFLKEKGIINDI